MPRWSPDGQSIAFIGGLDERRRLNRGRCLPSSCHRRRGPQPYRRAEGVRQAASTGSRAAIRFCSWRAWMARAASRRSISTRASITPVWKGPETLSLGWWNHGLSVARDGKTTATLRETFSACPEVWAGAMGEWKQITFPPSVTDPPWGKTENLHWKNEGLSVQGWLTYPQNYDPAKRYPLLVEIHGGPGAMARPTWPSTLFDFTVFSHFGYFVLRPNPRGSFGEGEAFTRGQRQGLRLRRFSRYSGGRRSCGEELFPWTTTAWESAAGAMAAT